MLESIPTVALLLACLITLITWWYFFRRPKNFPPGPLGLPIVGFLPFMEKNLAVQFYNLSKKYGPLVSYDLGGDLQVVFNDYSVIKKALVELGDAFTGRPDNIHTCMAHKERVTMSFTEGVEWNEQRRFTLSTLRDFGMGKSSLEPKILEELSQLISTFEETKGHPFDPKCMMSNCFSNVMAQLTFGRRFDHSDPTFVKILESFKVLMNQMNVTGYLMAFPWLRKTPIFRKLYGCDETEKSWDYEYNIAKHYVEEHKKEYFSGKKDDYIDAYLEEQERRKQNNNNLYIFDDNHLYYDSIGLFAGGTDTISNTVTFCYLYILMHPDIQQKLQQEIDDVIGSQRLPSMSDKLNMPYMDAFIMEVTRKETLAVFGFPRKAIRDVEINGYVIPKNTTIQYNLWAVHNDSKLWGDPQSFRPERFINDKGQAVFPPYLIPFAIGKRQCPGEALARMEVFLAVAAVLQRFTLLPSEEGLKYSGNLKYDSPMIPSLFYLRAIPRNHQ